MKTLLQYISERFVSKKETTVDEETKMFWSQPEYKKQLVPYNNIKPEFKKAYAKAKQYVALFGKDVLWDIFTIYYDENANLYIETNFVGSKEEQNKILYKTEKLKAEGLLPKEFKYQSAAFCSIFTKFQLLFNGVKNKKH